MRRLRDSYLEDPRVTAALKTPVIALFGIAPVDLTLVDPSKPGWRQV